MVKEAVRRLPGGYPEAAQRLPRGCQSRNFDQIIDFDQYLPTLNMHREVLYIQGGEVGNTFWHKGEGDIHK